MHEVDKTLIERLLVCLLTLTDRYDVLDVGSFVSLRTYVGEWYPGYEVSGRARSSTCDSISIRSGEGKNGTSRGTSNQYSQQNGLGRSGCFLQTFCFHMTNKARSYPSVLWVYCASLILKVRFRRQLQSGRKYLFPETTFSPTLPPLLSHHFRRLRF